MSRTKLPDAIVRRATFELTTTLRRAIGGDPQAINNVLVLFVDRMDSENEPSRELLQSIDEVLFMSLTSMRRRNYMRMIEIQRDLGEARLAKERITPTTNVILSASEKLAEKYNMSEANVLRLGSATMPAIPRLRVQLRSQVVISASLLNDIKDEAIKLREKLWQADSAGAAVRRRMKVRKGWWLRESEIAHEVYGEICSLIQAGSTQKGAIRHWANFLEEPYGRVKKRFQRTRSSVESAPKCREQGSGDSNR